MITFSASAFDRLSDRLPDWLWPENRGRRWIHGMAGGVAGGTLLFYVSVIFYSLLFANGETPLWSRFIFGSGVALTVGFFTTLMTLVPYMLGSLAARTARRTSLVVGACGVVLLISLSFRVYVYGIAGGGQAFFNMILHTVPFSTLVLGAWGIDVGLRLGSEGRSPSLLLASVLGAAIVLGIGGSATIWVLRDSPLWFQVGGPISITAVGLGFWATRRARLEEEASSRASRNVVPPTGTETGTVR